MRGSQRRLAPDERGGGSGASSGALRAVIVDDEPRARQFLDRLLKEHGEVQVVAEAKNGAEALAVVGKHKPDVVFLDIQMPDLSGLEVARHFIGDDPPVVVFVTAYDQHAVEAFEVAALDYLLKPIRRERLAEALRRVAHEVKSGQRGAGQEAALRSVLNSPEVAQSLEPLRRLPVRFRREVRLLDLEQVSRIVSRDRVVLACSEGREYLVDYTLQELEERLPPGQFVRAHRAALVNIDAIESYGGEDGVLVLRLKDGTRVEASERRAAEVRRKLR
jgi:two-component system LytT family response regulator